VLGLTLAAFVAAGLVTVGTLALLAPDVAARGYGVAVTDPASRTYVRAAGLRDVVIGGIVAIARAQASPRTLAGVVALLTVIAAGDLMLARRSRAVAIHAVGVLGLVVDAALLASGT
jgi:uncharacterized membrane protein (UPF0136 family)